MKHLFTFLAITALSLVSGETLAVGMSQKSSNDLPGQTTLQEKFGDMNASEFAALTPKEIIEKTGKQLSWREKILLKIAKKRIKKQLAKSTQPSNAEGKGGRGVGTASIILGGASAILSIIGLLVFFGPQPEIGFALAILGLVCGAIGLIFGIIGLTKGGKKATAIIGTVLSGTAVLFIFLAAYIAASIGND